MTNLFQFSIEKLKIPKKIYAKYDKNNKNTKKTPNIPNTITIESIIISKLYLYFNS